MRRDRGDYPEPFPFNPISHPDKNAERRAKVLGNMLEQGYIDQAQYDEAMADDVYSRIQIVNEEVDEDAVNTYFVDALTDDIMEDLLAAGYNETQAYTLLYSGGLKITQLRIPTFRRSATRFLPTRKIIPQTCGGT